MAERKNFSRYNMRCGRVLLSTVKNVKLLGFELPGLDSRFLFIKAEDIPGENSIDIFGSKIPLLAKDYIDYVGQPLLVLFGPDYESTELALEKVSVITTPIEEGEERPVETLPSPLFFSWGLDEEEKIKTEKETFKKVETEIKSDSAAIKDYVRYNTLCWVENNGSLHVECPSAWPSLISKTLQSALGISETSITIHNGKYLSRYDEYLIPPVFYSTITALATLKTKLPSEMRVERSSQRAGIEAKITSWLDEDNKPKHEEVEVTVDQGAFSIHAKEVQRQIMAGIIPRYNLDSFKAVIKTVKSSTAPSIYAGSFPYSFAVSAVALHNTRIAERTLSSPLKFLISSSRETTKFTDWAPKHTLTPLNERIKSVSEESDYERKWASASLHTGLFGLQGYLYGIGLSSALSISGISTSEAKENAFQAQISYSAKKNITINGTIPLSITQDKILKDLVSQYFTKDNDSPVPILFLENYSKTPDSGPDILDTYRTVFLSQLMKAANKLSSLIDGTKPVDLTFNSQNLSLPCEFEYSGYGAAVTEIIIPKVSLYPKAKKLYLDMTLLLPYSRSAEEKIKVTAIETLSALGAEIDEEFSVSIHLSGDKKEASIYSSLENTTRALVTSSYATALWQALGERSKMRFPVNAQDIDNILGGN